MAKEKLKECPACGADNPKKVRRCPRCGSLKCAMCDMGNDVECPACPADDADLEDCDAAIG